MAYTAHATLPIPTTEMLHSMPGLTLVEFGTDWCTHCQAAQNAIHSTLDSHPEIHHIKVEDGPGRPLGRFFRVKLWPTLVLLKDGQEIARVVRPLSASAVQTMMSPS